MKTLLIEVVPETTLTWNSLWIHPWESSWSLFQKLNIVNVSTPKELLRAMGTDEVQNQPLRYDSRKWGDLWTLSDWDQKLMEKYHLLHHKIDYLVQIEAIENVLPFPKELLWEKDKLKFCLTCLSQGYHSILHQLKLITHCPFHDLPLQSRCMHCGAKYHFHVYVENFKGPFVCKCGWEYLEETQTYSDIRNLFFRNIVNMKDQSMEHILSSKPENQMLFIMPDVEYSWFKNPLLIPYEQATVVHSSTTAIIQPDSGGRISFNPKIFLHQKAVFKSIARYIRKRYLCRHKRCIHNMKHGIKREGVCSITYAYLLWRKGIEGHINFHQVDNGKLKFGKTHHPSQYYSLHDKSSLKTLSRWVQHAQIKGAVGEEQKENLQQSCTIQLWLLDRVYPHLLWNHFLNWLEVAATLVEKDQFKVPSNLIHEKYNQIPYFSFSFDRESNIFSSWQYPNKCKITDETTTHYCYYNTKNKVQ
ncbi:hypothetical protein [Metabacillus hrfriensis]|uniref:Uncharacterized protein n=1 Tax=Metabacillus hrfriensis TaxID=3048891 RepID=A0ACD4RHW7_9BACI|nr:hypothetical protein [Metabacillus sp. CT-WN-B3]WHZ60074.1 hypothetical protein QLQ22_12395 [Metabacillus sp. CT-WN-B3]